MPVDSKHGAYVGSADRWRVCRDTAGGEDKVKAGGEAYLPKPSGQTDAEYAAYKMRAEYFNATGRTRDGLTGLIFRREPQVEAPEGMQAILDDVTLSGVTLLELASQVTEQVVEVGRAGILVDYPPAPAGAGAMTVAQEEDLGARPYLTLYTAEQIVNWSSARVGSRETLVMVVLQESGEEAKDEFERKAVERYRVLDLGGPGGAYRQRVYRKAAPLETAAGQRWVQDGPDIVPLMRGKPMAYIPFLWLGVARSDGVVETPPLYDLATVNLSHYRSSADLENGRHWTGVPTPVFTGLDETKSTVALGSTEGIVLPIGGDAKFLEFSGQGLQSLTEALAGKQEEMAVLGARILSPEKRQVEAAETAAIHRAGENGVLASIANTVSRVLTQALEILRDWAGAAGEVRVTLNTDYLGVSADPALVTALIQGVIGGRIAPRDLFWYLQRAEVIRTTRTYEEVQAEIEADPQMEVLSIASAVQRSMDAQATNGARTTSTP